MPIDTPYGLGGQSPPRTRNKTTATPAPRQTISQHREESVNGLFQLAGFGCVMTGNYADAAAIGQHSPGISAEIVKLGAQNEAIGRGIDYLDQVGPYAGLISATMPLVLQILANHKRIDHGKVPGLSSPEVLESKVKAQMAAKAAQEMKEAQKAQADYERELASMRQMMETDTKESVPQ